MSTASLKRDHDLIEKVVKSMETTVRLLREGKTIPELSIKYKKIIEEYEGVEKLVNTEESAKWKSKVWDNLTLDVVKDYIFSNGIQPRDDDEINDAFEQAFFLMVHIPYLQAFEDINKRVSRLSANIPLIKHKALQNWL